jgi:hypothetical protein
LGPGKTDASARRKNDDGPVSFWLAALGEWSASDLSANVAAVPNGKLESGGEEILPGTAAKF